MTTKLSKRLAVLIDAENIPAKYVEGLFEEIATIGEASVRRIYGNFSGTKLQSWTKQLSKFAIMPCQQFANTPGKNASDITLVIDALDLLYSERYDGFCIVSSDSDFARLATRIREQGVDVFGFGEKKTPESFRQACRRFIYLENLPGHTMSCKLTNDTKTLVKPVQATKIIRKAILELDDDDDGWVGLSPLGVYLYNLTSDFDSRTYGAKKLSDLVGKLDAFELQKSEKGMRVRLKPPKKVRVD